jgi:NTP pyrophosphatase (non-canonical NTP hydrolase)
MGSSKENAEARSTEREFASHAAEFLNLRDVMKMLREHTGPEYIGKAHSRLEHIRFLTVGMAGEAGEALNIVKKEWRGDDAFDYVSNLADEAADVANYAMMLLIYLGVDPLDRMRHKLDQFEARRELEQASGNPSPRRAGSSGVITG